MLGMGWGEIGFVLVVALIVLGPEKLPQVARTLGKGVRMLRRATADLRRAVEIEGVREDIRAQFEGVKSQIPDPYAAVRAEEKAWHQGSSPEADDAGPPGAIGAGKDEPPVWELTEHVTVAPLASSPPPDCTRVAMVAVPVRLLADLRTVPVWGGAQGLQAWLGQTRQTGAPREAWPGAVAMSIPTVMFRRRPGIAVHRAPLASVSPALTRVPMSPVDVPEAAQHKEAS